MKFNDYYVNRPKKVVFKPDTETVFVSQDEALTCSLKYQLDRFGMDGLQARLERMREKFGYADCTKLNDFAELQNKYRRGVEYFEALPSEIRREFNDRPEEFYEFCNTNKEDAIKAGFIDRSLYDDVEEKITTPNTDTSINEVPIPNGSQTVVQPPESA